MQKSSLILVGIMVFLVSCTPPPQEQGPRTRTVPETAVPNTASPSPAETLDLTPTPVRWKRYEEALSVEYLGPEVEGLCEWVLLGQTETEVYVWAMCQAAASAEGQAMSAPALIHLDQEGNIGGIEVPGEGEQWSADVRRLFPSAVQSVIFDRAVDTERLWAHIQTRRKTPQPPLIVQAGEDLP